MKKIILFISIIFIAFFLTGCSSKADKYNICIKECDSLKPLKVNKELNDEKYVPGRLSDYDYSDINECKTICINKYK
jgi:hypothetical protein